VGQQQRADAGALATRVDADAGKVPVVHVGVGGADLLEEPEDRAESPGLDTGFEHRTEGLFVDRLAGREPARAAGVVVGPERRTEIERRSPVVADHLGEQAEVLLGVGEHPPHERIVHERRHEGCRAAVAVFGPYHSPLRDEQVRRTRDQILDALIELLTDRRADDITTRDIAERAGVSLPTVYRHFPDRTALLEGITARGNELVVESEGGFALESIDQFGQRIEWLFATADRYAVEMRAEALLNADPRRFSSDTRRHSEELLGLVAATFPNLDERRHAQLAGLLRCLASSQSWLRMREEFGVPGVESGPLLHWAADTLIRAVRNGELPELAPASRPERDAS
jgi:AcrR family transcriptional regulator